MEAQIIVVDLGGQYTQLIPRRIREQGVRSIVLSPHAAGEVIASYKPKGIILSGGWASIYDADAPNIPDSLLVADIPILAICLGMHWLAHRGGGTVEPASRQREYGVYEFSHTLREDPLFHGIPEKSMVRMSHGDSVTVLPRGAYRSGMTNHCGIASFTHPEKRYFGVQFHPECADTEAGAQIISNFLKICNAIPDWDPGCMVRQIRSEVLLALSKRINDTYPAKAKLIHLVSGGVDSTVIARIYNPILQERLICVTIDTGGLREGEMKEIRRNIVAAGCAFHVIDAKEEFMVALGGRVGGMPKRLAFQRVYRRKIEELKRIFKTPFITQGTIATDLIESGVMGYGAQIKLHHNVGVESINPLRNFFKDEVRDLGRFLNLPDFVTERTPFPGVGLYIRLVDVPVNEELMSMVRWADARTTNIIYDSGIDGNISQLIVGIGLPRVGVKGDARVHGYSVLIRAVKSSDFMTGTGYEIPSAIRRCLISELTQHSQIVDVLFSETPKPPATFEFE